MWWAFYAPTLPLSAAILFSYAAVLFNAFGGFSLVTATHGTGYAGSPYWLGIPRSTVHVLAALQILAAVGYSVWLVSIAQESPTDDRPDLYL